MLREYKNRKPGESGIALIMVLGVLAVLLILAVTFAFNMRLEQRAARNYLDYMAADFYAKAGLEHAVAALRNPGPGLNPLETGEEVTYNEADFSYTVTPLSGRLDLNFTGNLSGSGYTVHNAEQGWTTFETSIADVFEALGVPQANAIDMAGEIITRRYGGEDTAGGTDDTYDESLRTGASGIDHDASGNPDDNFDPFWFREWISRGTPTGDPHSPEHEPFDAETLQADLQGLHVDFITYWDNIEDYITAGTRSSGELGQYINLNAVQSAAALFYRLGLSAGTFAQKAANIIDYRDANHHISSLSLAQTYYGVESILINEVLANSYADAAGLGYSNTAVGADGDAGVSDVFSLHADVELASETSFRLRIYYTVTGSVLNPAPSYGIRVWGYSAEGLGWVEGSGAGSWEIDYTSLADSTSSSAGEIFIRTRIDPDPADPAPVSITVTRVELLCAEFIELVNIGEYPIDVSDWVIEADGGRQDIPLNSEIPSGGYLVLTNDEELFQASYGAGNVVEIDGWNSYDISSPPADFSAVTNFNGGDVDILLYIEYDSPDDYLLGDIAVHPSGAENVFGADVANTLRPGVGAGIIGVSREKNDPAIRDGWFSNEDEMATPGAHNSRLDPVGAGILDNLGTGTYPPLVANRPFANVVGVQNVISGNPWQGISDARLFSIAGGCSAYYIRLDAERADGATAPGGWALISPPPPPYSTDMRRAGAANQTGVWEWEYIYLNPEIEYDLYIYGIYTGEPGTDLELTIIKDGADVASFDVEYRESDGARVARINENHIGDDGSLTIQLESLKADVYFDYLLLIPDGVPGKININAAEREVLMGLPGLNDIALADNIIANRPYGNVGELLRALTPAEFAPVANLVSVTLGGPGASGPSDIYRIISTGRNVGPMGDPAFPTSERIIEVTVRLSGGDVNVLSWKYVY